MNPAEPSVYLSPGTGTSAGTGPRATGTRDGPPATRGGLGGRCPRQARRNLCGRGQKNGGNQSTALVRRQNTPRHEGVGELRLVGPRSQRRQLRGRCRSVSVSFPTTSLGVQIRHQCNKTPPGGGGRAGRRLVGRWYNDLQRGKTIESFFGVEYESCCWAIRLVAQKYLNIQFDNSGLPLTDNNNQYSNRFQFQFVFKGLGSAGNSGISELLESGIRGYKDPFLPPEFLSYIL